MARDDVMKMDDRAMYAALGKFLNNFPGEGDEILFSDPSDEKTFAFTLYLKKCYQAEEKIKEMGKEVDYIANLDKLLALTNPDDFYKVMFNMTHSHPRDRARAILLTVEVPND